MKHGLIMRFIHKADIYTKSYIVQPSGQRKASWELEFEGVECSYIPEKTSVRVSPTTEETDKVVFFFPRTTEITYGSRISNVISRKGELLLPDTYEVMAISRITGYQGKLNYYAIRAESAVE